VSRKLGKQVGEIGSSLINQELLDAGDWGELTRRAAAFIQEVKKGRVERGL